MTNSYFFTRTAGVLNMCVCVYCTRWIRGRRYGRGTVGKEEIGVPTCLVSWLPSKFKRENVHVNPRTRIRGVEKNPKLITMDSDEHV